MSPYKRRCASWKKQKAREMRENPTLAEGKLWEYLRSKRTGFKFRKQEIILGYIVDFYCPELMLAIEADGGIHDEQRNEDKIRDRRLRDKGVIVLRFRNEEILNDPIGVLRRISMYNNRIPIAPQIKSKSSFFHKDEEILRKLRRKRGIDSC